MPLPIAGSMAWASVLRAHAPARLSGFGVGTRGGVARLLVFGREAEAGKRALLLVCSGIGVRSSELCFSREWEFSLLFRAGGWRLKDSAANPTAIMGW